MYLRHSITLGSTRWTPPNLESSWAVSFTCHLWVSPKNRDKLHPPSEDITACHLTALGIRINIPESSLSIEPQKNFQSSVGKLVYIHKCVTPARIFINHMLNLFRENSHKKCICLTPQFFQDLQWFQKILPHFNGVTLFKKPIITDLAPVYLDTCLSGIGGIWGNKVYTAPTPVVPGFDLKIVHLEMMNLVVAFRLWGRF